MPIYCASISQMFMPPPPVKKYNNASNHLHLMSMAKMELETPSPIPLSKPTTLLLEELRKGMLSLSEWVSSLSGHWVHRIFASVKAFPEFGLGKDFVGFVQRGHLGFGAAFVRVREFGLFSAEGRG
jgi:hypothetical protein